MSEKHRSYFNEKASNWDELMAHRSLRDIEEMIRALEILPGSNILDAGTGTGILLPILKNLAGKSGKIFALDIAEEMLAQARIKNGDSIAYVRGDLTATPFEQDFFDEIICYSCFPHIVDKAKAIQEIMRIAKPGGRVTICHTSAREGLNNMHQSIGGVVGSDMLPDDDTMRALFNQAGFADIRITDRDNKYLLVSRKP